MDDLRTDRKELVKGRKGVYVRAQREARVRAWFRDEEVWVKYVEHERREGAYGAQPDAEGKVKKIGRVYAAIRGACKKSGALRGEAQLGSLRRTHLLLLLLWW